MMDFQKLIDIKNRMCSSIRTCEAFPLYELSVINCNDACSDIVMFNQEKAEKILKAWDKDNPIKTFLTDFKEKYPKTIVNSKGYPTGVKCPLYLGFYKLKLCPEKCNTKQRYSCWNDSLESEKK